MEVRTTRGTTALVYCLIIWVRLLGRALPLLLSPLFLLLLHCVEAAVIVQGGAMNCGLLFAGPPPPPFGAVSGKISKIRWAAVLATLYMGAPVGDRQLRCYVTGCQLTAKRLARDRRFMKICLAPSASWSLVLKMKKLLNDGLDLT